jgi:hypothetical protein
MVGWLAGAQSAAMIAAGELRRALVAGPPVRLGVQFERGEVQDLEPAV